MKKYIVREGDTMWEISQATGVRLNLLLAANPQVQDPNQLQPGSLLVIPELGKQATAGHGATPQPFAMPHAQPPTVPSPMPPTKPVPSVTSQPQSAPMGTANAPQQVTGHPAYFGFVWPHVVTSGETWDRIAAQYGVPVAQLQRMNPELSQRNLQAGQLIYVPSPATPPPATGLSSPGGLPPVPSNEVGPHTHNPYRTSMKYTGAPTPYAPVQMPYSVSAPMATYSTAYLIAVWYNDWEESPSWDSDASSGAKVSDA